METNKGNIEYFMYPFKLLMMFYAKIFLLVKLLWGPKERKSEKIDDKD